MIKLSEVAKKLDIKQQRIQEYEKVGIAIKPKVKDKHGYWLYGEAEIERLWQIKFYLTLNFTVPEIKAIFEDPNYNKHDAIADQIIKLEKQKKKLESMIEIARIYNEADLLPSDILMGNKILEKLRYKIATPLMSKALSVFLEIIKPDEIEKLFGVLANWPTEEVAYKWRDAIEKMGEYYVTQVDYETYNVQEQVAIIVGTVAEVIPDSILKRWLITVQLIVVECRDAIKEIFGEDGWKYIVNAVIFYAQEQLCQQKVFEPVKEILFNLEDYGLKQYTTGSSEVQGEVRKIHRMVSQIGIFSEETQIKLLAALSDFLGGQEAKIAIDDGKEKGLSWFISIAIKIYCKNQRKAMEQEVSND